MATAPAPAGRGARLREPRARKAAIPPQISAARRQRRAEQRDTMLQVYESIVFDPSQPAMARVAAADKWLDRTEGKPPQATVKYGGRAKTLADLVQESMRPDGEAT
jgi:hypothetical protein